LFSAMEEQGAEGRVIHVRLFNQERKRYDGR
jgi:hypothetical protein